MLILLRCRRTWILSCKCISIIMKNKHQWEQLLCCYQEHCTTRGMEILRWKGDYYFRMEYWGIVKKFDLIELFVFWNIDSSHFILSTYWRDLMRTEKVKLSIMMLLDQEISRNMLFLDHLHSLSFLSSINSLKVNLKKDKERI